MDGGLSASSHSPLDAWVVGKGNELFEAVAIGDMNEWLGLSRSYSVGQRGQTVRKAMGLAPYDRSWVPYVGADLLISSVRDDIIRQAAYYQGEGPDLDG
jgi:hypothetical protein